MSSGKVFLGLIAGVAIGAALGVLFAPDKGWNTRKRISKKGEDLAEDLKEKFDEFLESIKVKATEAKDEVTGFANNAQSKASEAKKDTKTATA